MPNINIKKILVPIDFPNPSLRVIHQAATLARKFNSEIVMLHVMTVVRRAHGVPGDGPGMAGWDMLAEIIRGAQKNLDQALEPELDGLSIQPVLAKGGPAQVIEQAAYREKADLIMMPSRGHTFNEFLLGSQTAKALHGGECPVWTGAHLEESAGQKFAIRNILCTVDFNPHDHKTVSWATWIASEFGARLTLARVTAKVTFWGPGGSYTSSTWKTLVNDASRHIAQLRKDMGINADVFIGSGDVPEVLCQAVKQTKADLLVTGCRPYGGQLRTHGYGIMCAVPIPILCV